MLFVVENNNCIKLYVSYIYVDENLPESGIRGDCRGEGRNNGPQVDNGR